MPLAYPLDEIDLRILDALQERGRISNLELAERAGLSPAPCLRRVHALEAAGVIAKYVALLDPTAVDLGVTVFVQVRLVRNSEDAMAAFETVIAQEPAVLEAYLMAGDADYLLRVVVPDVASYERFFKETLARLDVVASSKSSFAIRQAKFSTALPVRWPAGADGPLAPRLRKRPARRRRR
jgi:Lrp/AsnC family leucine-responsive transcriptional regulator